METLSSVVALLALASMAVSVLGSLVVFGVLAQGRWGRGPRRRRRSGWDGYVAMGGDGYSGDDAHSGGGWDFGGGDGGGDGGGSD